MMGMCLSLVHFLFLCVCAHTCCAYVHTYVYVTHAYIYIGVYKYVYGCNVCGHTCMTSSMSVYAYAYIRKFRVCGTHL